MKNKIIISITILFVLINKANGQYCTNDNRYSEVEYFDSTEITVGTNIQYGIAADFMGNADTLLMDIYYPNLNIDTSSKRPFIMLFHGGGFSSQQFGDIQNLCVHLALRGFVCASVKYRIGHDFSEYGQFKARYRAIQDGHAAFRYISNNANAIRIDTNWLFVGGISAGSLLAMGIVYADQDEMDSISLLYNSTSISNELGNLYTSGNNLTNLYTIKGIFNNWGGIAESEVDVEEMVPTVSFHGALDTIVQIDADNSFLHYTLNGSRAIHYDLIANNICSEITVDTIGGHGIYRNSSSIFRAQRASCFFKSIFCNICSNFYSTDSIPSNCSLPLSIDDNYFGSTIKIYPNPIENSFTIVGIEGALDLTIYNSIGQLVYKVEKHEGEVPFNLLPGIYFITIRHSISNRTFTTKLIKN